MLPKPSCIRLSKNALDKLLPNRVERGHPLAGRSRSTDISCEKNFLLFPFSLLAQSVIFRVTRPCFLFMQCRTLVRTSHPSGSRHIGRFLKENSSRPWQVCLPQKTVGTTSPPTVADSQILWLSLSGVQPLCGSRRGRTSRSQPPASCLSGTGQRLIRLYGCEPTPIRAHCPIPTRVNLLLTEGFGQIKGDSIPHDVIANPAQLVRHRFDGHHNLGLGLLSLIETLNLAIEPDREVSRFHKRPGQILIPVLGIAAPFAFAVADLLTAHTPTVRSVIAYRSKSPYVPGLQHDRERQNLPDPRHGLKKAELSSEFNSLGDPMFEQLHLFIGAAHHRPISLHRQGEIPVGQ